MINVFTLDMKDNVSEPFDQIAVSQQLAGKITVTTMEHSIIDG